MSISSRIDKVCCCCSVAKLCLTVTPWTAECRLLCPTISQSLLKFMSIESVMLSNYLILCRPLLLLPSVLSCIRIFSSESVLRIKWPKYWSFSFSINPCKVYSGLSSFRIDWFDHLDVQGTLKSLQHLSLTASVLQHTVFWHPYVTTGKSIALTCADLCWQNDYSGTFTLWKFKAFFSVGIVKLQLKLYVYVRYIYMYIYIIHAHAYLYKIYNAMCVFIS